VEFVPFRRRHPPQGVVGHVASPQKGSFEKATSLARGNGCRASAARLQADLWATRAGANDTCQAPTWSLPRDCAGHERLLGYNGGRLHP
jgi:hypothetical protein